MHVMLHCAAVKLRVQVGHKTAVSVALSFSCPENFTCKLVLPIPDRLAWRQLIASVSAWSLGSKACLASVSNEELN